jgi:ribonuclease P protein component
VTDPLIPIRPGGRSEAYLSTKYPSSGPPSWVPSPYVDQGRAGDRQVSTSQGPSFAERLIQRCRHRSDFDALRAGHRMGGRVLWMRVALDADVECARVAYAIGRRNGTAASRNLLRRRIQSVLHELDGQLPAGRFLIGSHRPAAAVTYAQVCRDVADLVGRVRELSSP